MLSLPKQNRAKSDLVFGEIGFRDEVVPRNALLPPRGPFMVRLPDRKIGGPLWSIRTGRARKWSIRTGRARKWSIRTGWARIVGRSVPGICELFPPSEMAADLETQGAAWWPSLIAGKAGKIRVPGEKVGFGK